MIIIKKRRRRKKQHTITKILLAVSFFIICLCVLVNKSSIANLFNSGIAEKVGQDIDNLNLPLKDKKIVIDAGHGGYDPGTLGPITGVHEADINLEIAYKLKAQIEKKLGSTVIMTRTKENTAALGTVKKLEISERGEIIENANADLVLSIHQNYNNDSSKIRGVQILCRNNKFIDFVEMLQKAFNNELDTKLNYLMNEYHVLKYGNQPSVIIECGFFSNPEEEKLLATDKYQKRIIEILIEQINIYFSK